MCELCSVNRGAHARRAKGEVCVHCGGHGIVRSAERILTSILGRGSLTPLLSRVSLPIILSWHRRCHPLGRHPPLCPIALQPPSRPKHPHAEHQASTTAMARASTHTQNYIFHAAPPNGTMLQMGDENVRQCARVDVLWWLCSRSEGWGVDQVFAPGQIDCVCVACGVFLLGRYDDGGSEFV